MNQLFCQIFCFCFSILTGLCAIGTSDNNLGWRNTMLSLGFGVIALIYGGLI